tara:strand:- start:887 stop:1222 length:336 start_codon:yes stop_codon:yes gene_type:complete
MNSDILQLTENYVSAINSSDLRGVLAMSHETFTLTDAENFINGKRSWGQFLEGLFENQISFKAEDVLVKDRLSALHFTLKVNKESFKGVDLIEWNNNGQMLRLRAYVEKIT